MAMARGRAARGAAGQGVGRRAAAQCSHSPRAPPAHPPHSAGSSPENLLLARLRLLSVPALPHSGGRAPAGAGKGVGAGGARAEGVPPPLRSTPTHPAPHHAPAHWRAGEFVGREVEAFERGQGPQGGGHAARQGIAAQSQILGVNEGAEAVGDGPIDAAVPEVERAQRGQRSPRGRVGRQATLQALAIAIAGVKRGGGGGGRGAGAERPPAGACQCAARHPPRALTFQ